MENPPLKVEEESTNPFDEMFYETHGGTGKATWEIESDVDSCVEDCYDDKDEL